MLVEFAREMGYVCYYCIHISKSVVCGFRCDHSPNIYLTTRGTLTTCFRFPKYI